MHMKPFDAGKIADDLQSLVHHAEELLRAAAESAGDTASDARERAEESLSAVRERLADFQKGVKGQAQAVDDYVQGNPWTAVAVVGGLALILGLVMGRK
jgi:ElaB/YqjD/DUF883 family membrane-anchored ribosome-binding protein